MIWCLVLNWNHSSVRGDLVIYWWKDAKGSKFCPKPQWNWLRSDTFFFFNFPGHIKLSQLHFSSIIIIIKRCPVKFSWKQTLSLRSNKNVECIPFLIKTKPFFAGVWILHFLNPCLLASSLFLSCFCWHIAAFLGTLQPPINQWNSLKLGMYTASPEYVHKITVATRGQKLHKET